jgi:hypothetical protein
MNAPTASAQTFINLVVFILLLIGLYYLYQYLYGTPTASASVTILNGTIPMTKTSTDSVSGQNVVSATGISPLYDGGQYTVSFWTYIQDTKGFSAGSSTQLAHLMEISNNRFGTVVASPSGSTNNINKSTVGNTLLYVGLNPINGSLIVRQSTSDPSEQINNTLSESAATGTAYPLSSLISNYNLGSVYTQNDRCDIVNGIEYQRWILITVVGNGRTLDVYIDGKLARSCVYKANYALGGTSKSTATAMFGVNNNGALKGFFSSGNYFNYALTPDAIWSLYQAGPSSQSGAMSFLSGLFNTDIVLGSTTAATS